MVFLLIIDIKARSKNSPVCGEVNYKPPWTADAENICLLAVNKSPKSVAEPPAANVRKSITLESEPVVPPANKARVELETPFT